MMRGYRFIMGCAGGLLALSVLAQDEGADPVAHGRQVFGTSCATGYCHTLNGGSGGGAARLASRGFDLAYIQQVITNGMAQTRMPGFGSMLGAEELRAVIAYVASLNGITGDLQLAATPAPPRVLSATASNGRMLLHESVRGFGRCATCHEVAGSGVPVADPIAQVPADGAALRRLATPDVTTVTLAGESMPALVISPGATRTMFYDLTIAPPVLRTVDSNAVAIADGSTWRHADVLGDYNDREIEDILSYLREIAND